MVGQANPRIIYTYFKSCDAYAYILRISISLSFLKWIIQSNYRSLTNSVVK
jgi:hypothetical protein